MNRKKCENTILLKDDPVKGFLYSLGGTLLVSTSYITAKFALQGFNPETFSLVWAFAATMYAFGIVGLGRMSRVQIFPIKNMKAMIAMGTAAGAGIIMAGKCLALLDPTFVAFLWRFSPVLTIICGVLFLQERLNRKEVFTIVIMLFGGLLSVFGSWEIIGKGVIFAILACLAGSTQLLIAKSRVHLVHPKVLVAYRVGIGSIIIAIWVFASGTADFTVEARYWAVTLFGAFLSPCAGVLLIFRAYQYWTLSQSSIVLIAQPLFVLPMAYGFLRVLPTNKELIGGCIILIGALWLAYIQVAKTAEKQT